MIAMNGEVELDGRSFAETARKFLAGGFAAARAVAAATSPRARSPRPRSARRAFERVFAPDFGGLAAEHLLLVFGSLGSPSSSAFRSASPPGAGRGSSRSCSARSRCCRRSLRSRCSRS